MKRRQFLLGAAALALCGGQARAELVGSFLARLRLALAELYASADLRTEYKQFAARRGLSLQESEVGRYIRLRTLFEATRDGGLWHLQWTITDRQPDAKAIFQQWSGCARPGRVTAQAECDELSALLGYFCHRLDVPGVGLLWPTSNHTVACWCPNPKVRVVLPTSQIFLPEAATLGTSGFDLFRQPEIYPYTQSDAAAGFALPQALSDFFLEQLERYAGASRGALSRMRTWRSAWQRGARIARPDSSDPYLNEFWRQYA